MSTSKSCLLLVLFCLCSFFFLISSCCVSLVGLELLESHDPPESAFLVVDTTGMDGHGHGHLALGNFGLCSTAHCTASVTQDFTDDERQSLDPLCSMNVPIETFFCSSFSSRQIECCETADEFYGTMGRLTQEMLEQDLLQSHELMQVSGSLGSLGWEAQGQGMTVGVVLRPDLGGCISQSFHLVLPLAKCLFITW